MVATPETRATLAPTLATTSSENRVRASKVDVFAAVNFPTAGIRATEYPALVPATSTSGMDMRTSGANVLVVEKGIEAIRTTDAAMLVAVRGRVANPRLRAWTFTLDGHDFYVLRLGLDLTLVYDTYSEQWMDWDAFALNYWPVNIGFNWVGGVGLLDPDGQSWGSNVLIGDDTLGLLWFLDPFQPFDESFDGPLDPAPEKYFPRVTMGQVALTGRSVLSCYAAWLTTDMGDPAYTGASVTLEISDDAGKSFDDMGAIPVTAGDNRPELSWYSLGQIEAPGRLFRITDDGAVTRIDGMEMNDPDDDDK